jgi:hypothetical protein
MRRISLKRGESVVAVVSPARGVQFPKYLYTLGLYGIWRKRHTFVLTDRRVIIGQGVIVRTERSIPLAHVDDAVYRRRGLAAYCDLLCGGRPAEHIGPLWPLRARLFTSEVLAHA